MSKFFVESNPYHDNGTIYPQLFDTTDAAISFGKEKCEDEKSFNVWEIGENEISLFDTYIKDNIPGSGFSQYTDWMNSEQHQIFSLKNRRQWHIDRGHSQSWNEYVMKYNLGEEYLIKCLT